MKDHDTLEKSLRESVRETIDKNPTGYLIMGDIDKPFHRPECECQVCEDWRAKMNRPTHQELRARTNR